MQEHFNQYYPTEQIASKPSGSVYLAHLDNHVSQKVVLKVFDTAYFTSDQQRKKFLQEIEKIKQVKHSSIVPILDLGEVRGKPYVVREYLASNSLRQRLDLLSPQRLSLQEALTIIFQIGQVLSYAHQKGILHGNLRPENVFFNSSGKVLLSDFGIASFIDAIKSDDKPNAQTISYLAPEQLEGSITQKSDQYVLASLAYELITGYAPFSAESSSSAASLTSTEPETIEETDAEGRAVVTLALISCENSQCPDYGKVGSENIRKFGKTRKGVQRWQCKTCRMTWSAPSTEVKHHPELILLSELVPNLPKPIEEVVLKALAKEPIERYANIAVFLRALQIVLLLPTSMSTTSPAISPIIPLQKTITEPLRNTTNEASLAARISEYQKHIENNDYQVSKVLTLPDSDTYSSGKAAALSSSDTHRSDKTAALPNSDTHRSDKAVVLSSPDTHRSKAAALPNADIYHTDKTVAISNSDAYQTSKTITKSKLNAYRPRKDLVEVLPEAKHPHVTKPLPPTLWLAFALSGITLLLGTVLLYTFVPSHSPGSAGLLKNGSTGVSTKAHLQTPTGQSHTPPLTQLPMVIGLAGSYVDQTNPVYNLTSEGTLDWVHWGLKTAGDVDRKVNGQSQISNYSLIGSGVAQHDSHYSNAYDWSNGTPVSTVNAGADQPSGVYVTGVDNGFAINVLSSTTPRTLRVYIGVYKARGKLTASLGGRIYQDASLDVIGSSGTPANNGIYTLVFSSSVPNQILTVQYTVVATQGSSGFVSLQSATLQG